MLLEGKVSLITGSGRGIGRSIAAAFAREGATVAITGRDWTRLEQLAAQAPRGITGQFIDVDRHQTTNT